MSALHTLCCFYLDLAERNMSVRTVANSLAICLACKNTLPNEQAFARCEAVRQNSVLFCLPRICGGSWFACLALHGTT